MSKIVNQAWEEPAIVGQGSLKQVTQWDNGISPIKDDGDGWSLPWSLPW